MLVELGWWNSAIRRCWRCSNDGATVTDVARRYGVARQTVHEWLRRYAAEGSGRVGRSVVAAVVVSRIRWRRWSRRGSWRCAGPIRGGGRGRSCIGSSGRGWCRCRGARRWSGAWSATGWSPRRPGGGSARTTSGGSGPGRWSCGRWTSSAACVLVDGSEAKIVSGIDDHSRFVVSARVVARATARPVCDALGVGHGRHGVPEAILTDNGKVFTARFGPGPGRCASIGSAGRTGSTTSSPRRGRRPRPEGRALAQDAARRVPDRQGVRLDRRRPGPARWLGPALQPRAAPPVDRAGAAVRAVPARRPWTWPGRDASRPSRSTDR